MKKHLNKILFGSEDPKEEKEIESVSHFSRINSTWNSSQYNDFGIERVFRLFLVISKVFFLGIYIEYLSQNLSYRQRKITSEVYVILKTFLPFIVLYYSLWNNIWLFGITIYFLIETFLYVFYKIFLPEHNQDKTHNRSLILLFFNFIEVIASFGVIYAAGNYFNLPVSTGIDALYISLITGSTLGYGDYHPITDNGKLLVMLQIISTLSFLILFFNYFAPRIQDNNLED